MLKKLLLSTFAIVALNISNSSYGQISINNASTITENFNSIGSTATATLPTNWKMSPAGATSPTWAAAGNFTATTVQASSGSPTAGGRYNWGNGTTTTDRAIGFMTSGGYSSPNSIMVEYQNNTGGTITQLAISFDIERYRINSAAAAVTFFVSTDGSTWTENTDGASGAFSTGTSAYNFTSGTVVSKSFNITGLNLINGSNYYLRWNFNTTGSNSQGLGLDNVSLTATFSASSTPIIFVNPSSISGFSSVTGSNSASQNFTVRATNVTEPVVLTAPAGFQVSRDDVTFQDTVHTAFVVDSVPTQTIYVRQNSATLGATSGDISCTSAGATTANVALTGVVLSTEPGTQPSLTVGSVTASTIELTVGNTGGLSNWIIVAKEGSAVDGVPADGTDYTANATFSSGAIIATNNRVVLKGNGTSVTVTVPNPATTYHFAVYAYNDGGVAASTNYNETTPGTASATTLSVPLGWQINATNTVFSIDFDATVENVNNGSFAAASTFGASNPAVGQLNSNAWAYSANSAGAASFGGNLSTGNGVSVGGIGTSGGVFAYEVSTGNIALGVQPTGSVFQSAAGGNFTLRIQNKTGATLNDAQLSYILWVNNNEARSTTFSFSHSTDNSIYTAATDASYSSALASQGSTLWIPQYFSVSLSGLSVAADGFLYLRWSGTDNGGSGSRDEFAIDDINFIAERSSATLSTSGNFDNVLIDGNVSLTAASSISGTLNLKSGVLNTGGNLTLKSTSATATATVVGGTNASINGNVTAERFLPWTSAGNNGFRFVSHPLASNPVINTVSNLPTANNTLVGYNEGSNAYEGINNRAATWPQGIGYGAWTAAVNTLSFTGALQLSDVSAVSMGNAANRWNFAGNPFPSTIDWEALTTTDMQDAVWVWVKDDITEGGGAWASYVEGVSANGGSQYIAPMQGFMVRALNPGTPSIAYPAAARVSNQAPSFQRTQSLGDVYRVKVTKAANNSAMETVIRFRAMATPNHDAAYDAEFMSDFANATPDLYTTDANGVKYSINALPELGSAAVLVPLQLETFGAGDFSFTFDASQLVSGVSVQLEDTKLGTFTHLVDGQVVNFTAAASDAVNRFRLHFNGLATSVAANNLDLIQMYAHEGALYIRGAERAESLRILDISGRTVYSAQQLELDGNAIRPNLAKGTYLVQLVNEMGVKTVKVIF